MDRPRRGGEGGFALVTVIGVMFLALLLGAAAVSGAQTGVGATVQDQHARRAVQAALSGIEIARRRLNAFSLDVASLLGGNVNNICILPAPVGVPPVVKLTRVTVSVGSWCPAVTIDLGTGTTATYRVSPVTVSVPTYNATQAVKLLARRIVATGTADGVTRRVYLEVNANGLVTKALGLITGGSLDVYRTVPSSFRECRSVAVSSSAPDADC
jgi:type II secretory pathway pseudopilin PulG